MVIGCTKKKLCFKKKKVELVLVQYLRDYYKILFNLFYKMYMITRYIYRKQCEKCSENARRLPKNAPHLGKIEKRNYCNRLSTVEIFNLGWWVQNNDKRQERFGTQKN